MAPQRPHPVGVVIPTFDEGHGLKRTIEAVFNGADLACAAPRIVVAEAPNGRTEQLQHELRAEGIYQDGVITFVQSKVASRGAQMNDGISALLDGHHVAPAILLFLHADTLLPSAWDRAIVEAVQRNHKHGIPYLGCFRLGLSLETKSMTLSWPLKIMLYTANLRARWARLPYGDQAYFLPTSVLEEIGRFSPLPIMEDVDLLRKLARHGSKAKDNSSDLGRRRSSSRRTLPTCASQLQLAIKRKLKSIMTVSFRLDVLDSSVQTNPRRWTRKGVWKNTALNQFYMAAWQLGVSEETIYQWYYGRPSQISKKQ